MQTMLGVIFFSVIVAPTLGARILGIAPIPSYSHQIVFRPLWSELSLRGHQVTVLTTDPVKNSLLTNLTEIDLSRSYEIIRKLNAVNMTQGGTLDMLNTWVRLAGYSMEQHLQNPEVQALIKNESEHFDLLMIEGIYPAMFAFTERFKAPFIGLFSLDGTSDIYELVGNPTHPVLYPDFMLPHSEDLTFLERLTNTLMSVVVKYWFSIPIYHSQDFIIKKYFGEEYPPLRDIAKNVSMIFVNTDLIFHHIRPLIPSVIPIGGGTHLTSSKPLPKDLQRQLDSASQGVIYFSLGSNVKSKDLSENTRTIILKTFSELPYLVLWKFELEHLPGKPDNVIISKWFPQQDIFKHPNIKLFISQGGLQSTEEAIYNHIPIVGMPFFADQPINVKKIVKKGFGLSVDYNTLDKQSFKSVILEVIGNPRYRNRAKELAELAKDQPMTGLQRAIWWTEYVLRHKGAQHLKSPAADLPLYQYLLLDVVGFCLLVVMITIYLLILIFKFVVRIMRYFTLKAKVKVQ